MPKINELPDIAATGSKLVASDSSGDAGNVPASAFVQPSELATVATTGDYGDLNDLPTLGSASALDVGVTIGDVVQVVDVGGNPGLPVLDGSNLTNLPGGGDVTGPGSSTIGNIASFDSKVGTSIADSGLAVADVLTTAEVGTSIGDLFVLVDVGGNPALPAVDGSQLTNLPGGGDVVGPASSTDGAVALFDGTTGLLLQDGPNIGPSANEATVVALGSVSGSQNVDVQSGAVFTITTGAAAELTLTNLPSGRAWWITMYITDADVVSDIDMLFTNTINWSLADSSTSTTFTDQSGVVVGSLLRILLTSDGTSIYGGVW